MSEHVPVYFLPDPFTPSDRVLIGHMGTDGFDAHWVRYRDWMALTAPQRVLVKMVREDLDAWRNMHELPMSVGPQVVMGDL